ncbi:MAG: hypothetical protein ACK5LX_14340 [Oscillospiraceae bacterium]
MIDQASISALRMERQFLTHKANQEEYERLFRDTQPGQNVHWHGFGDPPSITFRADFDDIAFNRERQQRRELLKGRFQGGLLGWVLREDMELFAGLCRKPLEKSTEKQELLLDLIRREGPMNIQLMKEMTGLLVKEITPALHRLQEAFLIYEDQFDGEWDRGWYAFEDMFPDFSVTRYSRQEALKEVLRRFAFRNVAFDTKMAKSFYKLPEKEIKLAVAEMTVAGILRAVGDSYLLEEDARLLDSPYVWEPSRSIFVMHRNDFLVKSNEHTLKERFPSGEHETLQYLLIDGEFHGAVIGKFKYGPYILEDVLLDLPEEEAAARKEEIITEIYRINGSENQLQRYAGKRQ